LRSVHGVDQGAFVPHLAITAAIFLAMVCVAMLIYFINHVASRINFDTVIDLVYQDLRARLEVMTANPECRTRLPESCWAAAEAVPHDGGGYIQQLDEAVLADWAHRHGVSIRLKARIGDFVFPGAPLALVLPAKAGAKDAIGRALVIGPYPTPSGDLEFAVDQLVDIAVRALSSGVNDPRTANRILDRLGASLCVLASKQLPSGVISRDGQIVFQRNITSYDGLADAMFHDIRQNAKGSPSVLIRILDVLSKVALCEHDPARKETLRRHGHMTVLDGRRDIAAASDLQSLERRWEGLIATLGPTVASAT